MLKLGTMKRYMNNYYQINKTKTKKTYDLIYSYDFFWEKWSKNT